MRRIFLLLVLLFFVFTGSSVSAKDCEVSPKEALKKAKKICEKKEVEYDTLYGPYRILTQTLDTKEYYMIYVAKNDVFVARVFVQVYGGKTNIDAVMAVRVDYYLLDSLDVKRYVEQKKGVKVLHAQMVFPAKFWGLIMPEFVAWWIIDENGECYYTPLWRSLASFSALAKEKKRRLEETPPPIRD